MYITKSYMVIKLLSTIFVLVLERKTEHCIHHIECSDWLILLYPSHRVFWLVDLKSIITKLILESFIITRSGITSYNFWVWFLYSYLKNSQSGHYPIYKVFWLDDLGVWLQNLYLKFYDCIRPGINITIHLHVGDCQFEHFMNHGCFLIVWTSECDFCKAVSLIKVWCPKCCIKCIYTLVLWVYKRNSFLNVFKWDFFLNCL